MPQVANGYILSTSLIDRLGDLQKKQDQKAFGRELQCDARDTLADFKGDGFTFVALVEYLHENRLTLPIHTSCPGARILARMDTTFALIGDLPTAKKLVERIDEFEFDHIKLRQFYEKLNKVEAPDSGVAMIEALKYLKRGLAQLMLSDDWYYLTVS